MLEKSKEFLRKAKQLTTENLAYELSKEAEPVVSSLYGLATGNDKPFRVYTERTKDGANLVVQGKDVIFREFGAGVSVATDKVSPNAEGLPDIRPGSFSEINKKQFSEKGRWYYRGIRYTGIQPTLGLYNASKHIQSAALRKAKEKMK